MKQFLLLLLFFVLIQNISAQTTYTWNGSVSTSANVAANWTPNGVPGALDNAVIVSAANLCRMPVNASISNFTITSGTLDLGGNTLTVNGANAIFTSGTVQNGSLTVPGATTTTFGSGTVTMNCVVNVTSASVTFRNTTFQQLVNITKTGSGNDASSGNNIFNGAATITNAGAGSLSLANGSADRFNNTATFNNTGSSYLYVANNSSNNIFGGVVTFNNTPTANTYILVSWYSPGTVFNNNIVVSSNNGQGVQFCGGNGTASATLASGNTIAVGAGGFSAGALSLKQFTQSGATPQNLTLSGSANMNFNGAIFNGNLTVAAPNIYTTNSVYNGTTVLTKTDGASTNFCYGGNNFNGTLTVNYNSSNGNGYWAFGSNAPDIYNGDVYSNNNSLDKIIFGFNSANNQFNGNFIVTQTGAATGMLTSWYAGATSVMAAGKTVSIGAAGFTSGYLALQGFTQNGSAAINLTTTGASSIYVGAYVSNNPSFIGGSLTLTAPDISIAGGTFNAPVSLTKTGGISDHNNGYQNFFKSTLAINQQSSSGYFTLGLNSNDIFNDDITLTSTGSGGIYLGLGTGTPTLAAGKTILVGTAGFNKGFLSLNSFTQLGNAPMNLTFTGANTSLMFANNSVIGGNLTTNTPDIIFNSSTFNGTVNSTKTGASDDISTGNNVFNGASTFTSAGSGYLMLGNGNPDRFNAASTFNNTGSSNMFVAHNSSNNIFGGVVTFNNSPTANVYILVSSNSAGTIFNSKIIVNSTNGQGIQFCSGNTTATSTLTAGNTISVGAGGFSSGTLLLKQFTQTGSTPQNLTLTGSGNLTFGPASSFGGDVTSSSPTLFFNGCTFNGTVNSIKTGASSDASGGGNIFNNASTFTNTGSGYLLFGNGNADQFNAASTFNNTGSNSMYVAYNSSNNIFGGVATFNNAPTANTFILVSPYSAGTLFNNNIVVTSTNGQGVQFCSASASATASLAGGKTISAGAGGFSAGTLLLRQFTQTGSTPQNLVLTGSGNLTFGPTSSFGGNVTSSSPTLFYNGCTFNGTVNSTKTGSTSDVSSGNNVFNGASVFTNAGSGYLMFGYGNADQFNAASTFNNTGSSYIYVAYNSSNNIFGDVATFNNTPTANTYISIGTYSAGTIFNNNIVVTSTNGQGVQFCEASGSATMAAGRVISAGAGGFSAGTLLLRQFTQTGSTPQNLVLTGSGNLTFGPTSSFGGNVTSSSPTLFYNGCTFNGTVNSTKTGTSNDASSGNNIFNGAANITNAGSGYLMFGNGNADQFQSAVTFNNTGSSHIYVAFNSTGNIFNGVVTFNNSPASTASWIVVANYMANNSTFNNNIIVNNVNGAGIQFCTYTGTATLSTGNTITVGAGGFNAGSLILKNFTQSGATSQNIITTGTSVLQYGPSSSFGGNVASSSPGLLFNGCNFSGTATCTKTGASNDASSGNNIFNSTGILTNAGSGYLMFGNGNADQFQSNTTFNNTGSSHIYVAYNSTGNIFNGVVTFNNSPASTGSWIAVANYMANNSTFNNNIIVNNVNGAGIQFCTYTGTVQQTSGGSISVGAGGFNSGQLMLRQFTQTGAATHNILATGASVITYGPSSSFDGTINSTSGGVIFNSTVFNGAINATQTGAANQTSPGGNIFNNTTTISTTGNGMLYLANTTADAYNGNLTFSQTTAAGTIYPNYNTNCNYARNVTVTSPSSAAITFGSNTNGIATFSGSGTQNIGITGSTPAPIFTNLIIANTGSGINLTNTNINVSKNLTLNSGLLNTSPSYILTMLNGSTVASGDATSTSYVNGPMRYQKSSAGISTLNFPIGNSPDCRPIVLTVNHADGSLYTYEAKLYNASAMALGYSLPPTVDRVSGVHYYTIDRTDASGSNQPVAGLSGNQIIQIFFNNNDVVTNGGALTIVKNTYTAPTAWINIGGTGGPFYVGSPNLIGSVTSTSTISAFNSFSTFALADVFGGMNVLPTQVSNFAALIEGDKIDLSWLTSKETNNNYFTIEKSRDGVNFEPLHAINSKAWNGNSNVSLQYSATDANPFSGINYYRLKNTGLDGQVKYWNIVAVNFDQKVPLSVYPNPSAGTIIIKGLEASQGKIKIEWYDLSGRLLSQQTGLAESGLVRINTQLSSGCYLLKYITSDGIVHEQKIIIRK